MNKIIIPIITVVLLSGCASMEQKPDQIAETFRIEGTSIEVQHFIETKIKAGTIPYKLDEATDRFIKFSAECSDIPEYRGMGCVGVRMQYGNRYWAGPYATLTFRTTEIRGVVHLSATDQWCFSNAFGKVMCNPKGRNEAMNERLRVLSIQFAQSKK